MSRVGIALDGAAVAVVMLDGDAVVWEAEGECAAFDAAAIRETVLALLHGAPRNGWQKPTVHVVLSRPHGRVKRVSGYPAVRSERALRTLITMNIDRFVASPEPVYVTGVEIVGAAEAKVGIVSRRAVDGVLGAVAELGYRARYIVPAEALPAATRVNQSDVAERSVLALARTACGASRRAPLALDPERDLVSEVRDVPPWRLAVAAMAFIGTSFIAIASPVWAARRGMLADEIAHRRLAARSDSAAREAHELAVVTRDLGQIAAFSRNRIPTSLLLDAVADALPDGAALSTVRVDTAGVDLVVLSQRTADVLDAVGDLPGTAAPALVGPVSREGVAGRELERATIRLRLDRTSPRAQTDFAVERDQQ